MVSFAKMALLQSCGKLCEFTILLKKTYLDNPYYLIYSIEVINLLNRSKVLSAFKNKYTAIPNLTVP